MVDPNEPWSRRAPHSSEFTPVHEPAYCSPSTASLHRRTKKPNSAQTGADAVEMEAAGVAATRRSEWSIPFYCVRVVTDTADETFRWISIRLRDPDGRFSRSKILAAALRSPRPCSRN